MKFFDNTKYKISNPAIGRADEQRADINKLVATEGTIGAIDSNFGVFSLELAKEAMSSIKQTRKVIQGTNSRDLSAFDQAVAMDIAANLGKVEAYLSYVYDTKTPLRIGSLLRTVFGPGTFQKLQDMAKPDKWPHKKILENGKTLHPLFRCAYTIEDVLENCHDPVFGKLREGLLEKLNDTRNEVQRFYSENGIVSDLGKIKFHYSPTSFNFSYWEGLDMNHVHLNSRKVIGYLPKNSSTPEINSAMIKPLAIHEVGHALHEATSSKTMPTGLSGNTEGYVPFLHGTIGEGCAMNTEDIWFQQARDTNQLNDLDVKLTEEMMQLYNHRKLLNIVFNIFRKRDDEMDSNPKSPVQFNKRAQFKLAELTGVRSHMFINTFSDMDIHSTLYAITYIIGHEYAKHLNVRAKNERYTPQQVMLGMMKGSWTSLPAQEKFLFDVYLPHLQKKGIGRL